MVSLEIREDAVIPLVRRIARIRENYGITYIIRLPKAMNDLWEEVYRGKKTLRVYIKI